MEEQNQTTQKPLAKSTIETYMAESEEKTKKHLGPIMAIVIISILLTLGGFYIWGQVIGTSN